MLTSRHPGPRLVYIPCKLLDSLPGPAIIETADGWVQDILAGHVEIVDGKTCVVARHVEQIGNRHRVRFRDGNEAFVFEHPSWRLYDPRDYDFPVSV